MAAKRERSRSGKHPANAPDALLSPTASLPAILAGLEGLELDGLRRQWRNHLGGEPPAHLPRWLLLKVLGHRLQIAAFGDHDKSVRRLLREESARDGSGAAVPFDRREAQTRDGVALRPGALLVREWKGKLERIMVLEQGFAWNGQNFGSLSQIAKAMTGTNWNGHRFFGLRQTKVEGGERPDRKRRGGAPNQGAKSIPNASAWGSAVDEEGVHRPAPSAKVSGGS